MRHFVYSLAALALAANGVSTSATVDTPQMAPAAPQTPPQAGVPGVGAAGPAGPDPAAAAAGGQQRDLNLAAGVVAANAIAANANANAAANAAAANLNANLNAAAANAANAAANAAAANLNAGLNAAAANAANAANAAATNAAVNAAIFRGPLAPPTGFLPNVVPAGVGLAPGIVPGNIVGYLNGGWIKNWNTVWTGAWRGNLIGYWNTNLKLLAPLNVWAPATVTNWNVALPINRYGPAWGSGTLIYPALSTQSWWTNGQRFSWSFLPLTANADFVFTEEMRTCILKEIEERVQAYDSSVAPGWLVPVSGSTQLATDIAYGTTDAGANWISWVIPFGAPNGGLISSSNFVTPFVNILKSPQFYSEIENDCHIPASNFTVLNKQIQFQSNSWAATTQSAGVDMTEPVMGSASSFSSLSSIIALPFISLAALLRRD